MTYAHIDSEYVKMVLGWDNSSYSVDESVVIINIEKIDSEMYLADMGIITNLIDYYFVGDNGLEDVESPEEAIQVYQDTIKSVNSAKDIQDYILEYDSSHAELIVDGDIPPSAIHDVM